MSDEDVSETSLNKGFSEAIRMGEESLNEGDVNVVTEEVTTPDGKKITRTTTTKTIEKVVYENVSPEISTQEVIEGDGLKEGTVGQPILFTLDGSKAGPGQLSCRCRSPTGTMTYVYITDNKDGTYTVDLNATEPGLHTVEVEWDNAPIPGSPFLVRIMQAPDVKKVRAFGPGLESGLIADFQGNFKVDTKGAGPGTLKVRIHGPKGAFKVEMSRDHPKERAINVKYNPTESGIYTANVFWSDEHVPGSPFEIFVANDEQHLNKWEQNREQIQRQEGLVNGY